ncbi:hypothetical protein [Bradyrhizobium sp.]|uniref:hypothetical protein n=1 Tax=Bradyrhizobium sp. TaxID=376 RepID=UPI001EB98C3C|nr:hypothetical protein [Bradyrhizobium sp.]MBV9982771.1 hypothetical protein [Bradyrhizobium sp.]
MPLPIAFVLLQAPAVPDLSALIEALRRRHPDLSWTAGTPGPNRPRSAFILCGKRIVILMPVEQPLAAPDEEMWARAATAWPEAHEAAALHRAHVIVSLMGDSQGKVEDAKIVTAVVGGLISITADACGVVFCGRVARSSQIWLELSARAFAPYPDYPFMLWIDIVPFESGPQSAGALTYGLSRFTGREIEFQVPGLSGPTLLHRVAGLAGDMLERGDRIEDGDTSEASEPEQISMKHRISHLNGAPVLRVGSDPTPMDRG